MANRREASEDKPEIANYMQGKIKRVSSIKTIYVQDIEQWERARVYAEAQGLSMSELIMAGITKLVDEKCARCKRIENMFIEASGSVKVKGKK